MKKLILISAALVSVTVLSGCKRVVVHHTHRPDVVVDTRHRHEHREVHVIRHDDPQLRHPGRGHGPREVPPGHARERVVKKKQVIVVPERSARFQRHVEEQSRHNQPPRRNESSQRRNPPQREQERRKERKSEKSQHREKQSRHDNGRFHN